MFTTAAKNAMLDGLTIADASLHSAYSASGANEVNGGSYVRKPITFAAANDGSRAASSQQEFDVPGGSTAAWIGLWGQGSPSQFLGMNPLGGSAKEIISVQLGSPEGVFTVPSHGYSNGDRVVFWDGTVPGGLTEGTIYYVINATTDTFSVAATEGGAGINISSYPTGLCKVSKIVPESFGSDGTLTVSSGSIALSA